MLKIQIFGDRLKRTGIKIELIGNYPWAYIHKVNGNTVKEKFMSEHGFTVAFINNETNFTDIGEIFKIIRKYR